MYRSPSDDIHISPTHTLTSTSTLSSSTQSHTPYPPPSHPSLLHTTPPPLFFVGLMMYRSPSDDMMDINDEEGDHHPLDITLSPRREGKGTSSKRLLDHRDSSASQLGNNNNNNNNNNRSRSPVPSEHRSVHPTPSHPLSNEARATPR